MSAIINTIYVFSLSGFIHSQLINILEVKLDQFGIHIN